MRKIRFTKFGSTTMVEQSPKGDFTDTIVSLHQPANISSSPGLSTIFVETSPQVSFTIAELQAPAGAVTPGEYMEVMATAGYFSN